MIHRKMCCALMLGIIAGCGSGDSNDQPMVSASPNPPAATPAPPDNPPPDNPPPQAPPPTKASVPGDVLIAALSRTRYSGHGPAAAARQGYPSTMTFVEQRLAWDPSNPQPVEGTYSFSSAGYMNRDPYITPRYNLGAAQVTGTWSKTGAGQAATFALGEQMEGDTDHASEQLSNSGGLLISAAQPYDLDQTLAQWQAPEGTAGWDASLEVQSDYADTLFRVCWKLSFPGRKRTSCGVFERVYGDLRGIHVVDDSQGFGLLVWRSRDLPPRPVGAAPAISGDVLIRALSLPRYSDPIDGAAAGQFTGGTPSTATFVEQRVGPDPGAPQSPGGAYAFESAGYMNRDPMIPPRYNLRDASAGGRWTMAGSGAQATFTLGEQFEGDNGQEIAALPGSGALVVAAAESYELDRTLAQWTNLQLAVPWDAALQIHSDDVPEWFRLCWQMTYPKVIRQSCGLFDRQSGDFMGVHVVDDSENLGPLVWRSGTP